MWSWLISKLLMGEFSNLMKKFVSSRERMIFRMIQKRRKIRGKLIKIKKNKG